MVMLLERDEQNKLLKRPGENGVTFEGGVPVLKGMLSVRLGLLYSRKIGEVTLQRKLEGHSMDAQDIDYAVDFLIEHHVRPTPENVARLWTAAQLYLMFDAKSPGWVEERLASYGG